MVLPPLLLPPLLLSAASRACCSCCSCFLLLLLSSFPRFFLFPRDLFLARRSFSSGFFFDLNGGWFDRLRCHRDRRCRPATSTYGKDHRRGKQQPCATADKYQHPRPEEHARLHQSAPSPLLPPEPWRVVPGAAYKPVAFVLTLISRSAILARTQTLVRTTNNGRDVTSTRHPSHRFGGASSRCSTYD
jgi:hypothetical protein